MGERLVSGKFLIRMGMKYIMNLATREWELSVEMVQEVQQQEEEHVPGMEELLNGCMKIRKGKLGGLASMCLFKPE